LLALLLPRDQVSEWLNPDVSMVSMDGPCVNNVG